MTHTDLNKLALESGLSRKTHSVTRDTKRNQLIVVEEVSKGLEGQEGYRVDQSYFMYEDPKTTDINHYLADAKSAAVMRFLGLDHTKPAETTKPAATPKDPIVDIDTPEVEAETPTEKPKPKGRPKKGTAKKGKKKEAIAPTAVYEGPAEEDCLGLDNSDEDDTNQVYQKGNSTHAECLKSILNEKYGKGWPKDKVIVGVVKGLVAKIKDTVAVVNAEGEMLSSFEEYVVSYLKKA